MRASGEISEPHATPGTLLDPKSACLSGGIRHDPAVPRLLSLLAAALVLSLAGPAKTSATDLELADLAGQRRSLAELRGHVVVLNFWATWCAPCREEMPLLSRIHRDYERRGVRVLGAATQTIDELATVERAARRLDLAFPTWIGATTRHMRDFGLGHSVPATLVVDRDGQPVARILGLVVDAELRRLLDDLLATGGRLPPGAEVLVLDATIDHSGHDHDEGEHGADEPPRDDDAEAAKETGATRGPSEASLVPS